MSNIPPQDQVSNLKMILVKAQSNNNEERNANENQIKQMVSEDNVAMINLLMMLVNSPNDQQDPQAAAENKMARALASIVFKNVLYSNVFVNQGQPSHQNSPWFSIDKETRDQIKTALLSNLGDDAQKLSDKSYMKDICLCISTIATLEIPTKDWVDFVDMMASQGNQNENQFFKFAGIYNLGLIMDNTEACEFPKSDYFNIWNTMINNIDSSNIELTEIVAQAINRLSAYSDQVFQDQDCRNKIMQSIFDLARIQNTEIQANTLQALMNIVTINYQFMEAYLNQIYDMTAMLMSKVGHDDQEDEKIARFAIEVWNSIYEEEIRRQKTHGIPDLQIVRNSDWQKLATLYCNNLVHTGLSVDDQSIDEDNDGAVCVACTFGLSLMAQIICDDFIPFIFQFVQQYIAHSESSGTMNWITKYICVMAMNSSINGPSSGKLQELFSGVMNWIYECSSNESQMLKSSTGNLLSSLTGQCPQLFVTDEATLGTFWQWYQANCENVHPRIIIYAIQAMQNLFVALDTSKVLSSNVFNNQFADIISSGIRNILKTDMIDGGHLIPIQDAINEIVQTCEYKELKDQLHELCNQILNLVENQILTETGQYNQEQVEHLMNAMGGLLQVIIARLESSHFDEALYKRCMAIITHISAKDSMRQGTLLIINGMINSLQEDIIMGLTDNVLNLIEETIQDAELTTYRFDISCRRMGTGIIQDIITGLGQQANIKTQRIMGLLNVVLESAELTTDVKIFAIGAVGDLCLMCEGQFFNHLEKTMNSLVLAGQMSLQCSSSNKEEQKQFNDLRTVLCDAFISIINGIKSPSDGNNVQIPDAEVRTHMRTMFYFIDQLMLQEEFCPELAEKVIDLYCDIFQLSGNHEVINDLHEKSQAIEFARIMQNSQIRQKIQAKFGPIQGEIRNLESGQEILDRYSSLLQQPEVVV